MVYLSNAFSLQMCKANAFCFTQRITLDEAKKNLCPLYTTGDLESKSKYHGTGSPVLRAKSIIGHKDICALVNKELDLTDDSLFQMNREAIQLNPGDVLYVGQYVGGRLPEGAKELPEGSEINWYKVICINFNALEFTYAFREFCHPDTETGTEIQFNETLKKEMIKSFPEFEIIE
jgi:hypothetical protein